MPTVPIVDQTATGAQPFASPNVATFRNGAPEQIQQLGATVQQAGNVAMRTGQTIGDALAAQVDDARVKTAEATALSQAQQVSTQFLNTRGQDTIDGYHQATTAVAKSFQDQADALTNPIQKHMFMQVQNQHLLSYGQRMGDHNFQQTSQYAGEAAVSRATSYADNAASASSTYGQTDADGNGTGEFAKNLAIAEQETLNGVRVLKGAPADSDVAKGALLNLHTQVFTSAISQMMDERAPYSKVQTMFADAKAKGMLSIRAQDTLGKAVKTYSEQEMVRSAINDGLSDAYRKSIGQATTSTGTPDYDFAIKGATVTAQPYDPETGSVSVPVAPNSKIQAPADGKVVSVGKDADDNFALGIQHANGSVTTFTGISAANVKVGDTVQRGEDVAQSGEALQWSLADKNGSRLDPTRAGLGPVDLTKITDEKVLSDALNSVRSKINDPVLQQQATSEMESVVRHNQQMQNTAETQLYKQAGDAFYKGGENWRAIPPSLFNQLSPEHQQDFKDKQTDKVLRDYSQGQQFREMGSVDIRAYFIQNPEMLTQANVDAARPKLSNSDYLSLTRQANEFSNDATKVVNATAINKSIEFYAGHAGVNIHPKTDTDKLTYIDLQKKINDGINLVKQQNNGKATQEQVDAVIKKEVTQHTITTGESTLYKYTGLGSQYNISKPYAFQVPAGATHTAKGSDGKQHYTNAQGADLGIVP